METQVEPQSSSAMLLPTGAIEAEIRQKLGDVLSEGTELVGNVKDAPARARAVDFGLIIQAKIKAIKSKREEKYAPLARAVENLREMFDTPIKHLEALKKGLSAAISAHDVDVERQQRIERERREAEARRQQEEYERQRREWEAAEAKRKAEEERKRREAEEVAAATKRAEEDRLRREREAIEEAKRKEQEALDEKIKAEEDARVQHAEVAQEVGNVDRVDHILDKPTAIPPAPVAPVPAPLPTVQVTPPPAPAPLPEPEPPPPPPPPPLPPSLPVVPEIASFAGGDGTVRKDVYRWRLKDPLEFARAVAEKRIPLSIEYRGKTAMVFEVHSGFFDREVQRLKSEFRCPGIEIFVERQTDFRALKSGGDD